MNQHPKRQKGKKFDDVKTLDFTYFPTFFTFGKKETFQIEQNAEIMFLPSLCPRRFLFDKHMSDEVIS